MPTDRAAPHFCSQPPAEVDWTWRVASEDVPEVGDFRLVLASATPSHELLIGPVREYAAVLKSDWLEKLRLGAIEAEVRLLKDRVSALEKSAPVLVPVETFAPEAYDVVKPFQVVVQASGDDYLASFFDANLSATGGTAAEAFLNLKDIIVAVLDCLTEHAEGELGPGPSGQLRVLSEFVRKST